MNHTLYRTMGYRTGSILLREYFLVPFCFSLILIFLFCWVQVPYRYCTCTVQVPYRYRTDTVSMVYFLGKRNKFRFLVNHTLYRTMGYRTGSILLRDYFLVPFCFSLIYFFYCVEYRYCTSTAQVPYHYRTETVSMVHFLGKRNKYRYGTGTVLVLVVFYWELSLVNGATVCPCL